MLHQFCIRNAEDRCIQCRDYAPRKRVCPAYRLICKQAPAIYEQLQATEMENARLKMEIEKLKVTVDQLRIAAATTANNIGRTIERSLNL